MANQQGSSSGSTRTHAGGSTHGGAQRNVADQQGQGATGVRDSTYNLISVAYHALQGAQTYLQYEQDAGDDQELAQFFRQVCEEEKRRAQQAKQLLMRELQRHGGSQGQQLQGGTSGQQSAGNSSASRSHQQSQAVPGDNYGETPSSATGGPPSRGGQQAQSGASRGQMGSRSSSGQHPQAESSSSRASSGQQPSSGASSAQMGGTTTRQGPSSR